MKAFIVSLDVHPGPLDHIRDITITQYRLLIPTADNLMVWEWNGNIIAQHANAGTLEQCTTLQEVDIPDDLLSTIQNFLTAQAWIKAHIIPLLPAGN